MFVSDTGAAFARGKIFLEMLKLPVIPSATPLALGEDKFTVKKAYASQANRNLSMAMLDVIDKSDGQLKILSAGKNRFGLLGQGNDVKESEFFKPVKFGDSPITHIELGTKAAFAVAKDGKLYAWGNNDQQQMGLELGKDKT